MTFQQDPIGLAGGMNLYGYAGGDPVKYGDPFGLCPRWAGGEGKTRSFDDCPEGSFGYRIHQFDQWLTENAQCVGASSLAVANVAADATTLLGAGAVVRAGALAFGNAGAATVLARNEVVRELVPAAIQRSQAYLAVGSGAAARTGLGHLASTAGTNAAGAIQGAPGSFWDFVPVSASVRSIRLALKQCGA